MRRNTVQIPVTNGETLVRAMLNLHDFLQRHR